jgi:HSP20 family protein
VKVLQEEKPEKERLVRRERYMGEMTRTITLPTLVDVAKIEAVFEQGVLSLYIPKAEEVKPKEIPKSSTHLGRKN